MEFVFEPVTLKKRYPLRISRGLITENNNLWVKIADSDLVGFGEMAAGGGVELITPERGVELLSHFTTTIHADDSLIEIWHKGRQAGLPACVLGALDNALWDLHAKRLQVPLYHLLGLPSKLPLTSVTIGINPPEIQRKRVPEIIARTGAKVLKVKLGSSEGIEADQAAFIAVQEGARHQYGISFRVDANGGWSVDGAIKMMSWLKEHGVQFVEQPLPKGAEADLPALYAKRALPLFVDESCCYAEDVPKLHSCIDGVVVKLMKCGGITEALRLVAVARAHRLNFMLGCMGESSIGISAAATIGGLFDYLDLDSHLNLAPDPADGVTMEDGRLVLVDRAGHGGVVR